MYFKYLEQGLEHRKRLLVYIWLFQYKEWENASKQCYKQHLNQKKIVWYYMIRMKSPLKIIKRKDVNIENVRKIYSFTPA